MGGGLLAKEKKEKPKKEPKAKKEKAPKKAKAPKKGKKGGTAEPVQPARRPSVATAASTVQTANSAAPAADEKEALDPKKKKQRLLLLILVAAAALACYFIVPAVKKNHTYENAILSVEKSDYETARKSFVSLGDYKNSRVLGTYALAKELYNNGYATTGTVLDQVAICLESIPESYNGELAEKIKSFKSQFGYYRTRQETYNADTAFLHEGGQTTGSGGSVKHNNNFYEAFEAFYEGAAHFWDEDSDTNS